MISSLLLVLIFHLGELEREPKCSFHCIRFFCYNRRSTDGIFCSALEPSISQEDMSVQRCFALQVALGQCNELLGANPEAEGLLQDKHSTKGLGKMAPSPSRAITL